MADGPRNWLVRFRSTLGRLHRGEALALVVVSAYVLFVAVSAATAPPLSVGATEGETETYVGNQGPFRGAEGYAVVLGSNGTTRWESPEAWAHFDIDRLEGGRLLAGFMVRNQQECGPYDPPCARTGFRIYDRSRADPVVREWTFPVRSHVNSEAHDATMLPNGNVVVSDMEYERVVEVNPDGEIVWQWNASSHYEAPDDPTRTDWLHINDVDHIGDGRFLVSVRNANQLVVVDREEGVVEVVNEDGDPAVMSRQHNPQYLGPDRILVADSENDRVVELRTDDTGEWDVDWQLRRVGGVPLDWPRDVDLLPSGNLLITDSLNNRVVEVTRNGTLVWSKSTRPIPYEADRNGTEYPPGLSNATTGGGFGGAGDSGTARTVPVLSDAYAGFVGTLSAPYWFRFSHFVGLVVALLAALVGLGSSVSRLV